MSQTYAEVILPLPLNQTFTYHIPEALAGQVKPGHRVIVQFGARKYYTAIVVAITPVKPEFETKPVEIALDSYPIIRHPQLKLWEWISDYYLCAAGDVYKAAVPPGLKIESETIIEVNPDFGNDCMPTLSEREMMVWSYLSTQGKMSPKQIGRKTGFRNVESMVSRLIEKGAAVISEKLSERYRAKKEQFIRLKIPRGDESALHSAFDAVKGARKQETILLAMLDLSDFTHAERPLREVGCDALLDRSGCTRPVLKELEKKGLLEIYTKEVSRFQYNGPEAKGLPELSVHQSRALREIHDSFFEKNITLLHGVTSSGKTEIYIHLIDYVLRQGNQVLYLVPEIALTTQLTSRLQQVFGKKVVIYHSRFSDNERVEIWKRLLNSSGPCVVIGARSAIFLPYSKLGIVIVDEEHEASYKQTEPAPRYNGRDTAIVLASMHGAKTLLGSATPTIETYYKATSGKYGLVTLSERFDGAKMPEIEIVDMAKDARRMMVKGIFSTNTINEAREAIARGEQVIFFHNRRGFAPLARCRQCQYIPKCEHCDVSLTYHRRIGMLVCHYCGATYPLPDVCPSCKEPGMEVVGYGTERIEEEISEVFNGTKILRMDLDTTRNKDSYENIIEDFSGHKADILVGTQMVTKGLDFGDVSVVSILNADAIINFPDFRSTERAYNMLEQVAGRAGRRNTVGKVMLQTHQPDHPVIGFIKTHDYKNYFTTELEERRVFNYPPFTRLVYIYLKHRDQDTLDSIAAQYGNRMRQLFGTRVFGPEEPMVARIQSFYIRKIMLKIEIAASMKKVKEILRELYVELHARSDMKSLIVYYDVDPQ